LKFHLVNPVKEIFRQDRQDYPVNPVKKEFMSLLKEFAFAFSRIRFLQFRLLQLATFAN